MSITEFGRTLNEWGALRIPFLFLVDFEMVKPLVYRLDGIDSDAMLYNINGITNAVNHGSAKKRIELWKIPPSFAEYKAKYESVRSHLAYGDSYLTNLTIKTEVRTALTLRDIFFASEARYKLVREDRFLVFSPETFVRIEAGTISAYPMKGTIDASLPGARDIILADRKEMAEHVTIVDLLRNDISTVAANVQVTNFRYVEEIKTNHKDLLQVSSEITGDLPSGYRERLGDIILKLLPAGSVSGAPKRKTVEIIRAAEGEPRGYYTGIVGIFDGEVLDSGVMIRYLEQEGDRLYYRSGGGITVQSAVETEYQETIDKVYVPIG